MVASNRLRLRISCPTGTKGAATKFELITRHGAVLDLSDVVTKVTWSMDGSEGVAWATFEAPAVEIEGLGELTDVTISDAPVIAAALLEAEERGAALARAETAPIVRKEIGDDELCQLVGDLADVYGTCEYDLHGHCQAHDWWEKEGEAQPDGTPGRECPHARARRLLNGGDS